MNRKLRKIESGTHRIVLHCHKGSAQIIPLDKRTGAENHIIITLLEMELLFYLRVLKPDYD